MKTITRILIGITAIGSLALLAALQQPTAPATAPVAGQDGGPSWRSTQDVGGGVELETSVAFSQPLVDPSTGGAVRATSVRSAEL